MSARYDVGGVNNELLKNDIVTITLILLCYRAPSFDFGSATCQF